MASQKPITALDDESAITRKVAEVRAERRRLVKLPNTATAVVGTHKLECDLLARLAELRDVRKRADDETGALAGMPLEELADGLVRAVPGLPDDVFDLLAAAVDVRRTGRPTLRVVEERK